jgi:hypothetical protein
MPERGLRQRARGSTWISSGPSRRARPSGADVDGEALAGLAIEAEDHELGAVVEVQAQPLPALDHRAREVAVLAVEPQVALDALAGAAAGQLADREHAGSRIIVGVSAEGVVVAAALVVRDDAAAVGVEIEGEVAEREAQAIAAVAAVRRGLAARGLQGEATLDAARGAEPDAAAAGEFTAVELDQAPMGHLTP